MSFDDALKELDYLWNDYTSNNCIKSTNIKTKQLLLHQDTVINFDNNKKFNRELGTKIDNLNQRVNNLKNSMNAETITDLQSKLEKTSSKLYGHIGDLKNSERLLKLTTEKEMDLLKENISDLQENMDTIKTNFDLKLEDKVGFNDLPQNNIDTTNFDEELLNIKLDVNALNSKFALASHSHSSYVNPTIADNLTTDSSSQVLSAKQGKILNDKIGNIISIINGTGGS